VERDYIDKDEVQGRHTHLRWSYGGQGGAGKGKRLWTSHCCGLGSLAAKWQR